MGKMTFRLKVHQYGSVAEFMQSPQFEAFDKECRKYEADMKRQNLEWLENEAQRMVFIEWYSGVSVDSPRYRQENQVSDYDFEKAKSAILSMCSAGCG